MPTRRSSDFKEHLERFLKIFRLYPRSSRVESAPNSRSNSTRSTRFHSLQIPTQTDPYSRNDSPDVGIASANKAQFYNSEALKRRLTKPRTDDHDNNAPIVGIMRRSNSNPSRPTGKRVRIETISAPVATAADYSYTNTPDSVLSPARSPQHHNRSPNQKSDYIHISPPLPPKDNQTPLSRTPLARSPTRNNISRNPISPEPPTQLPPRKSICKPIKNLNKPIPPLPEELTLPPIRIHTPFVDSFKRNSLWWLPSTPGKIRSSSRHSNRSHLSTSPPADDYYQHHQHSQQRLSSLFGYLTIKASQAPPTRPPSPETVNLDYQRHRQAELALVGLQSPAVPWDRNSEALVGQERFFSGLIDTPNLHQPGGGLVVPVC